MKVNIALRSERAPIFLQAAIGPFHTTGTIAFGPSLTLARDVPLHHKSSVFVHSALSQSASEVGRNNSGDAPNENVYYDYEDDGNPSVTPPDVIYPNPDRLPPISPLERNRGGGEAREIKSSNFVLRGIAMDRQRAATVGQRSGEATLNNNRVLMQPNEAADFSLVEANQDMKDHDLIDSIMYIYYGTNSGPALERDVANNIVIIGAVTALAAQLLMLIILFMKQRRSRHKNIMFPVLSVLLVMAFFANFLFIIGVQSSREALKCEVIAMVLHYLHLSTTFWIFLYIFCAHEFIKNNIGPNMNLLLSLGVGIPAMYIFLNYVFATNNYEVSNYCWMSVKKGMIFNYMLPISFFIVATAVYGTLCLRLLRIKQRQQFTESIESFIEHSRSEQMLNQIRQMGTACPQQAAGVIGCLGSTVVCTSSGGGTDNHKKLARCHSNPSSTTMKKSTVQLRSTNMTTSSINLTSSSMSPTKEVTTILPQQPPACCAGQFNISQPNIMSPPPPLHCLDMMGTSKSICGESKYSLGSISLANLSIQSLSSETEGFDDYKSAVKFAILFQIMFSICWFLSVIALEYPTSMMPIIYVVILNIVNWILLAKCQSICPVMIVSPLPGTGGPEHSNSFSKKSVKSNKSGAHSRHSHRHPREVPLGQEKSSTAIVPDCASGERSGGDAPKVGLDDGKEKVSLATPFDDQEVRNKDGVCPMDTIPLLAKSAGLRTDLMNTNAPIIDNLDGEPLENVVVVQSAGITTTGEKQVAGSGHRGSGQWSASIGQNNIELGTHRPEFISTIST